MRTAEESSERDANGASSPRVELSPETIRAALDKILASPGFINAERLSRFLRYTVDETLSGQTDKLKETLLGIEVFGRKPTYDPRVDAVVRTEAVKLRARLRDYYEGDGREDELIIDLPKGGYVPAFRLREKTPDPPPPAAVAETFENTHKGHDWRPAIAGGLIIAILAVSIYLTSRRRTHAAPTSGPEVASIAVLPFADLSPDRDQEYFCDGMTEEIIDALAKIDGFRVVARTSSFAFKGKQQDIREIGKKLNVGAVLEGSVRKDGNLLRVTAQLNSVADGYHLWSQTYERELKDVFAVQDEIAKAIVNTLQLKLATPQPKRPSENVEAYDLYLQGRYHWNRWRTEGAERALQFFELATQKDPRFAAAYAGIADSYAWLGFFGSLPPNDVMPKARAAADKAIALDDSLAEAHTSLGYVKALYDFDWPGAEHEFQRAIQLNPGLADAHFGYGIVYMAPQGRLEEALREMQLARDLDPLSPVINTYLALAYFFNNQPEEGLVYDKKALDLDPTFVEARLDLAMHGLDPKAQSDSFETNLIAAKGLAPESRIDLHYAFADAVRGKKDEALALVRKWERPPEGVFVRPSSIAMVYAALGDKEQMYTWLDRAYTERDGMLAFINKQACYGRYLAEPRFIALNQKLGLPGK